MPTRNLHLRERPISKVPKRESREGPVVRELDGKGPACREAEGVSVLRGHHVTTLVRLHPPLVARQVPQRVDGQVGVVVVNVGVVSAL